MFGRVKVDEKDGKTSGAGEAFQAIEVEEIANEKPAENGDTDGDVAESGATQVDAAAEGEVEPGDSATTAAKPARRGQTLGERLSELRAQLQRTPSVLAEVTITVRTGAGLAAIEGLLVPGARHLFLLQAAVGRTGDLRLQREMEEMVTATVEAARKELDDERERLDAANRAGGTRVEVRFSGERKIKVTMKSANAMQLVGIVEAIDALATTIHVAAFSRTVNLAQQHQLEDNLRQRCGRLVEHLRKLEVQALRGYNDQVRKIEQAARRRSNRSRD